MRKLIHNCIWYFLNHTYKYWPDALWLRVLYRIKMHRKLHLNHPRLYTEKLQWLKLHDRNPLYSTLVDKYDVKQYIKEHLGEEYVIPNYGVWNHFDEIDFDKLPNQFILKCTHDSGNVWICKDKSSFDKATAKEKMEESLKHNFFWWTREWPYKNVKGRIIAEKYMTNDNSEGGGLTDYKFYCFNGEPKLILVATGRFTDHFYIDYYDSEWNKLYLECYASNSDFVTQKPQSFEKMMEISKTLSKGIPHVRIDLYDVCGQIYFGECTFYESAGFCEFNPPHWDADIGDMLNLVSLAKT